MPHPDADKGALRVPGGCAAPDEECAHERLRADVPAGRAQRRVGAVLRRPELPAPLASGDATANNVTFEPGCRNFWHIHHAKQGGGQVIICVDGEGWYQEEGKAPQSLTPGDIVEIPAGVKHWHGAKAGSWFSRVALAVPGEDTSYEWLEPVDDEHYSAL